MSKKKRATATTATATKPNFGRETLALPFLLLLLVLPAVFFQVTTDETFKVSTEFIAVVCCWVFVAASAGASALARRVPMLGGAGSKARLVLIGLLVWIMATSTFGFSPLGSWGYTLTVLAYMLAAQALLDWVELRPAHRTLALGALALLIGLEVVISLAQFTRAPMLAWGQATPVFTWGDRLLPWGYWLRDFLIAIGTPAKEGMVTGTLGNINYLAELLILTTPVLVLWMLASGRNWLRWTGVAVGLLGLLLLTATGTRAALLGAVLAGGAIGLKVFGWQMLDPRRWWSDPKRRLALIAGVVVLGVLLGVAGQRVLTKLNPQNLMGDSSFESRVVNWRATVDLWAERPLTGSGVGSYKLLNQKRLAETHPQGVSPAVSAARFLQSHNDPLQALAELGLIGFGLAIAALVLWIRETWRNPSLSVHLRAGLIWGVGALLISSLFGFPLHIPLTALVFVLLLAIGLARDPAESEAPVPVKWMPAYAAGVVVLAALVGWQAIAKGVWPLYMAHRYEYVAEKLKKAQSFKAAEAVLELADRHNRFKGSVRWQIMQMKIVNGKPDEALALFDASAKEGLGMDAWYWKGRAHQLKKQYPEALAAYGKLVNYYDPGNTNHQRAAAQTQVIYGEMAKAAPKKP